MALSSKALQRKREKKQRDRKKLKALQTNSAILPKKVAVPKVIEHESSEHCCDHEHHDHL